MKINKFRSNNNAEKKQFPNLAIISILSIILVIIVGICYQKVTDETYKGMSVIPEERKDIGLYKGLEPRRTDYVIEGDHWKEIYEYYINNLPKRGWTLTFKDSKERKNISNGYATWEKEGQGELNISTIFTPEENQTQVMFDLNKK